MSSTHVEWARDNQHLIPKDHKVFLMDRPRTPEHLSHYETAHKMIHGGWIRKADVKNYDIGTHEQIPTVIAHVKKHHPEVRAVGVKIRRAEHGGPMATSVQIPE